MIIFDLPVELTLKLFPDDNTAEFSKNNVIPPEEIVLSISTSSSIRRGVHSLNIIGKSGNRKHNTRVLLRVKK